MEPPMSRRPAATGPHAAAAASATAAGSNFEGVEAMPEAADRDWSELHVDALSLVFTKLGAIEVLMGAGLVCRSWLHAAKLPDLWRSVDMSDHEVLQKKEPRVMCAMAKVAVDRSCGQLETFMGKGFVTDDLLKHVGDRAPSLKKLCLISCYFSIVGITETIKKFPLLEDLELSFHAEIFWSLFNKGAEKNIWEYVFETIGKSCTRLTHFKKCEYSYGVHTFSNDTSYMDREAIGMAAMTKLRSLQLFGNKFGNNGLMAILDNCLHLESLDIRQCLNIIMDNELRAKLARIKTLRLPNDSTVDYQYPIFNPLWVWGMESESDDYDDYTADCAYDDADYIMDSDDYDDYCDPFCYLDGVYESKCRAEVRMIQGMRMLMKDSDDNDDY